MSYARGFRGRLAPAAPPPPPMELAVLTQPREPFHHVRRYGVLGQKRRDQIADEEEQPTGDEAADDDGQRLRGLVFALQRDATVVTPAQTDIGR